MERRRWVSNIPRTLAVATTFVLAVAYALWDSRLLDRLDAAEVAALAAFAALFVAFTIACDAELRGELRRAFRSAAAKSPGAKRAAT